MTETTDALADRFEAIRRAMAVVAADRPTPEQIAEWNAADREMAQRIRAALPGVPLHHAYAVLQALRATQRLEAAAADRCPHGCDVSTCPCLACEADQTALRDRIAAAIWERQNPGRRWVDCEYRWRADAEADADAVLAVLPAPADRAAILREAADTADRLMDERYGPDCSYAIGGGDVARELRRVAGEAQQPETQAVADCPYGEGPGDGSGCIKPAGHDGDHVVTPGVAVVPCSRAVLQQPHIPHVWWPQPGMAYVHCPGRNVDTAAVSQPGKEA
jgi:hypothetical protein